MRPWSADICGMYELQPTTDTAAVASRAAREFSAYLVDLARSRRRSPGEDVISACSRRRRGDRLTEDELVGTCVLLLNAGHEASVNGSGNGWWALFRHPDQLRRLRDDVNGLLGTAIEELLRIDTSLQMFERWVLEDIVVEGIDIRRGSEVALLFGSANHDPRVFDSPEYSSISAAGTTCTSRGGDPLLPRRAARADGAGGVLRDTFPPDSALVARGGTALEAGYVIRGLESPGHDPVSDAQANAAPVTMVVRARCGARAGRCDAGGAVVGTTLGATLHDAQAFAPGETAAVALDDGDVRGLYSSGGVTGLECDVRPPPGGASRSCAPTSPRRARS